MEIIQLTEDGDDALEESSAESEGPVFVCCFCLDQFSSHERVNVHQNTCSRRFTETSLGSTAAILANKTHRNSVMKPINKAIKGCLAESVLEPDECSTSSSDNASNFLDGMMSSSSAPSPWHIPSLTAFQASSSSNQISRSSQNSAPSLSTTTTSSLRRPPTITSMPFVPTLKTRSQKKLDKIMEKHNSRSLMLQECNQMKEVPTDGAWWTLKHRACSKEAHHPTTYLTQNAFTSALGLAQATVVAAMVNKGPKHEQEVDLDCEIISVEGPLSAVCQPLPPKVVEKSTSASPRSTRSLMSQLSRDGEINTRRKLSFCFVEDEWADKQAINEGRDPLQISLLTLDFSSPLGQRVKKYVRGEGHLNTIKDVESYCKTELDEDGYSKLRYRGCDFRITYRKKKRASHYVHKYKFNKTDRLEFKNLLKTGLSAYSRHVKQRLPVCKVILNKLTKSQIKLWTQETKITISEQIIFDDDICITKIDIPESRLTQGLNPDAPSSSHHLYRQTQHLTPSSLLSVGRLSTNSDRSLLSSRMSASPPHVPNIFRNRTSHTSSPPRPSSVSRTNNLTSGMLPHNVANKFRKNIGEHDSKLNYSSRIGNISSQHKTLDRTSHNLNHLSGHVPLSPSTYSALDRSSEGQKINGDLISANRRKQQLTHVRRDDGDGGGSHNSAHASRNTAPVGRNTLNPHSRGLIENHRSNTVQKHGRLDSCIQALQPSTRKLSNFDYFSIRDGKMQPSYLNHSHAVVSQHRTYTPSTTHPHNRQNIGIAHQNSPPHNHHRRPHSQLHHHRHLNSTSQPASGQVRPSAIREFSPFLQHNSLSSNGKSEGASLSVNHRVTNIPRTQTLHKMTPKTLSLEHRHQNTQNTFSEDDDVMEVICIDDD